MRVVLFSRRPRKSANFSVEHIVQGLLENLGPGFEPVSVISRFESNGFFRRAYNVFEAAFRQGEVNHITGEVHFLTYLLHKDQTVLTILDCGRIAGDPDFRKRLIKLLWFTLPVHRCAAITVISAAVKRDLLRHVRVDPDKIRVIPVAVPSVYRAVPKQFNASRPRLLQIGTAPNKNLMRLFEAISPLSCTLDIVGKLDSEHLAALEKHGVEFRNFTNLTNDEMLARYVECDAVVFASTFEGFGMPIVEGNLVGRPVVTGNTSSMPEVAGNAACVVDPFDVAAIRAGIVRVTEDEAYRDGLIAKGFENAKRYEHATIARQFEAVYREVAGAMPNQARLPVHGDTASDARA